MASALAALSCAMLALSIIVRRVEGEGGRPPTPAHPLVWQVPLMVFALFWWTGASGSVCTQPSYDTDPLVILMLGQSNCEGFGKNNSDMEDPDGDPNVLVSTAQNVWVLRKDQPLTTWEHPASDLVENNRGSAIPPFADHLSAYPGSVLLLMACEDGSSIAQWNNAPWVAGENMYEAFEMVDAVVPPAKAIDVVIWHQGFSDVFGVQTDDYGDKLSNLIDDFNAEMLNRQAAEPKWVVVKFGTQNLSGFVTEEERTYIRAEQQTVIDTHPDVCSGPDPIGIDLSGNGVTVEPCDIDPTHYCTPEQLRGLAGFYAQGIAECGFL